MLRRICLYDNDSDSTSKSSCIAAPCRWQRIFRLVVFYVDYHSSDNKFHLDTVCKIHRIYFLAYLQAYLPVSALFIWAKICSLAGKGFLFNGKIIQEGFRSWLISRKTFVSKKIPLVYSRGIFFTTLLCHSSACPRVHPGSPAAQAADSEDDTPVSMPLALTAFEKTLASRSI